MRLHSGDAESRSSKTWRLLWKLVLSVRGSGHGRAGEQGMTLIKRIRQGDDDAGRKGPLR